MICLFYSLGLTTRHEDHSTANKRQERDRASVRASGATVPVFETAGHTFNALTSPLPTPVVTGRPRARVPVSIRSTIAPSSSHFRKQSGSYPRSDKCRCDRRRSVTQGFDICLISDRGDSREEAARFAVPVRRVQIHAHDVSKAASSSSLHRFEVCRLRRPYRAFPGSSY